MRDPSISGASFPLARCDTCGKTVLTCVGLAADGSEVRLCAHCDAPVASDLEWVTADELESVGYYFGSRPTGARGGCGCASGGGGCARKN